MHKAGLYTTEAIRPVNEMRMRARWKLGRALADLDRQTVAGPGRGNSGEKTKLSGLTSFSSVLKSLRLSPSTAMQAQRIGSLPTLN